VTNSVILLTFLAVLLYAIGTVGYLIYVVRPLTTVHRAATIFLLLGFAVHSIELFLTVSQTGLMPVSTLQQTFSLFSWAIVGSYLLFQLRFSIMILGSFVSPLAVIFLLIGSALPTHIVASGKLLKSFWLTLHISAMFVGNAIFALAFCGGIMYLLQEHQIKKKRFGLLYRRLPSLQLLDSLNHVCVTLGFPLITIGLISGFVYAGAVWRSYWNWDPKEILSVITWLIYAVLLHERLAVGWRGRRAAIMAIVGFSAILITFVGANLGLKSHHSFLVD